MANETYIGAGEFKAKCLRLLDEVAWGRTTLVITKRGRPIAKLVPLDDNPAIASGSMATTIAAEDEDDIVGFA